MTKTGLYSLAFPLLLGLLMLASQSYGEEKRKNQENFPPSHVEVRVFSPDQVAKPQLLPDEGEDSEEEKGDPLEMLQMELQVIRDELRMLQATLDLMINRIMADIQEENQVLREEVQRLYLIQKEFGLPDTTHIPRPGIGIIRDLLQAVPEPHIENEGLTDLLPDNETDDAEPEEEYSSEPPQSPPFTLMHEWGRTPEMVEELDHAVSTLKGIVGIVPEGCRRIDLEQLGRELRSRYDDYENINIEIFDDEESAEAYIATQVGNPDHRVLSISRHSASGRDVILYLNKGEAKEVTP
ncbi:MAG: hypothetical protein GX130_09555 [Candidatus Hydrogenedens sp.]|jgi:hypothetical protein|nr:hypothetical protein [Candidatus Hydrogenedens sp.]